MQLQQPTQPRNNFAIAVTAISALVLVSTVICLFAPWAETRISFNSYRTISIYLFHYTGTIGWGIYHPAQASMIVAVICSIIFLCASIALFKMPNNYKTIFGTILASGVCTGIALISAATQMYQPWNNFVGNNNDWYHPSASYFIAIIGGVLSFIGVILNFLSYHTHSQCVTLQLPVVHQHTPQVQQQSQVPYMQTYQPTQFVGQQNPEFVQVKMQESYDYPQHHVHGQREDTGTMSTAGRIIDNYSQ